MAITKVVARQIFDSRGNPTVEVDLTTDKVRPHRSPGAPERTEGPLSPA